MKSRKDSHMDSAMREFFMRQVESELGKAECAARDSFALRMADDDSPVTVHVLLDGTLAI